MSLRRGMALLLALLVIVVAGVVAVTAGRWAMLQQQAARGWRDMARHSASIESEAASWLAGDSLPLAASWGVVDSLAVLRFDPLGGASQLEIVCRQAAPPPGTGIPACLPTRGFLRTVR